jgi:hypothetical protein
MSLSQWTAHPDYPFIKIKAAVMAKVEEGKHSPALRKIKRVETMAEIEQEEAEKAKASKEKKRQMNVEEEVLTKYRREEEKARRQMNVEEILTKYEEHCQQKSLMEVRRREEQREIEEANERAREWEGIPGPDGNTLLQPITDEGDFEESQIEFEFVLYESA